MSHAEVFFLTKTSNYPGLSVPLQPSFGALKLPLFLQTSITFERGEISDYWWNSGKYNGADDGDSKKGFCSVLNSERDMENCGMSHSAYFKGDRGIIVLCTIFLVFSSINVFFKNSTWLDTFWTDLIYGSKDRQNCSMCQKSEPCDHQGAGSAYDQSDIWGAGNVLSPDMGTGYMSVFTVWKFTKIHYLCTFYMHNILPWEINFKNNINRLREFWLNNFPKKDMGAISKKRNISLDKPASCTQVLHVFLKMYKYIYNKFMCKNK